MIGAEGAPRRALGLMARRADFLAANRGQRAPMPGFVLLVHDRRDGDPTPRIGITVTKKIGGAVIRNRMKRRFRALVRAILPEYGLAGADHVLIGREGGVERDYAMLSAELEKALHRIASGKGAPPRQGGKPRRGSGGRATPAKTTSPKPGAASPSADMSAPVSADPVGAGETAAPPAGA